LVRALQDARPNHRPRRAAGRPRQPGQSQRRREPRFGCRLQNLLVAHSRRVSWRPARRRLCRHAAAACGRRVCAEPGYWRAREAV
ncbi:hypothetical protein LPJ70_003402, partial [Coemansia sp. RSA 2708]